MISSVATLEGVNHGYKSCSALSNIELQIPAGKMCGLIGPDGVGKSTLMALISGAKRIQSGSVTVLDGDMSSGRHRRKVCTRIAYMPQGLGKNLYAELSVFENLDFFGRLFGLRRIARHRRIDHLLRATGMNAFKERPAGKLSGGMKQKLGLCCALIHDPDLLLLDEPTTGVDPLSRQQFWALIDSIRAERPDMSVLVSTAYMDEAEKFDWLVAMHAGEILSTGSAEELRQQTNTNSLEEAFVALLPAEAQGDNHGLVIPERISQDGIPAIETHNLTRRFGDFVAVNNVSFKIERGEIFGFLGSNGCGKTTTMKMLTGLLPATEGDAELFGEEVNAGSLEMRRRVGYMSQAFSLYAELTVSQNLWLHARLFHLPAGKRERRITELSERFGLTPYMEQQAEDLPLGLRQRLSLAVAIIHEPEMLILDEPTSGVDPVARDSFWELLIELSRKDHVTIFISTHFMNEALRCDRISLMHAGNVLACDTPEQLIANKQTDTLEAAFIDYISEAIEPLSESTDADTPEISANQSASARHTADNNRRISLRRLLAYSYRESLEILRDPVRLAFAYLGSVLFMLVLGYGISTDVNEIKFAVYDQDRSPESRSYIQSLIGTGYFLEKPPIHNQKQMDDRMKSADITLAFEIPARFGLDYRAGAEPEIAAWIDGSNPQRADTIEGYVNAAHQDFLQKQATQTGETLPELPVNIEQRFRYNPTFESIYSIVPSVPPLLLMLIPAILMAVSVVKEKELGSITNFYVTPTTRLEFLLGKQLPYIAIGFTSFLLLTLMSYLVFQVPITGSASVLFVSALLYVAATTGIGLLISSFTKSQVAAVFVTAIITMMPTVQFSGMMQPVSTLEGQAQTVGNFWPTSYYMQASIGAFTKGLGATDLAIHLLPLLIFFPVLTLISVLALRQQEK